MYFSKFRACIFFSNLQIMGKKVCTSQPGPLTLFAPTNAAFDHLPATAFAELVSDPVALKATLLRHMTRGAITSADLPPGAVPLVTGAGEKVTVTRSLL